MTFFFKRRWEHLVYLAHISAITPLTKTILLILAISLVPHMQPSHPQCSIIQLNVVDVTI